MMKTGKNGQVWPLDMFCISVYMLLHFHQRKSTVGMWTTIECLQVLIPHIEPLTDQQLLGICNLQQSSQQAEDALSQGMDKLQQTLAHEVATNQLGLGNFGAPVAAAMEKLDALENFVSQVNGNSLVFFSWINSCLGPGLTVKIWELCINSWHHLRLKDWHLPDWNWPVLSIEKGQNPIAFGWMAFWFCDISIECQSSIVWNRQITWGNRQCSTRRESWQPAKQPKRWSLWEHTSTGSVPWVPFGQLILVRPHNHSNFISIVTYLVHAEHLYWGSRKAQKLSWLYLNLWNSVVHNDVNMKGTTGGGTLYSREFRGTCQEGAFIVRVIVLFVLPEL